MWVRAMLQSATAGFDRTCVLLPLSSQGTAKQPDSDTASRVGEHDSVGILVSRPLLSSPAQQSGLYVGLPNAAECYGFDRTCVLLPLSSQVAL